LIQRGEKSLSPDPGFYSPDTHAHQVKFDSYSDFVEKSYQPRKDGRKHLGLDVKDIDGASPKDLK
jgi:hypothetical protein